MSVLRDFPFCKPDFAQSDWECGPCGRTRDSEPLEECNFDVATERLDAVDPYGRTWEIICWRHWAVGWVEEIFTKPGSEAHKLALGMREALGEYPCLDDERLAEYESEDEGSSNA